LPFLDEIENLLLFARQSNHTVYQYSIMRVLPVNPEDGSGGLLPPLPASGPSQPAESRGVGDYSKSLLVAHG
jgi:hypothetical protein